MSEKLPQHVIMDLLPLYLEGETSKETRRLIEEYLNQDPELAELAALTQENIDLQEVPAPLNKENEMQALQKMKRLMVQHNVFLTVAIVLSLMAGLAYLFLGDEPRGAVAPFFFGGLAAVFWVAFLAVNRNLAR